MAKGTFSSIHHDMRAATDCIPAPPTHQHACRWLKQKLKVAPFLFLHQICRLSQVGRSCSHGNTPTAAASSQLIAPETEAQSGQEPSRETAPGVLMEATDQPSGMGNSPAAFGRRWRVSSTNRNSARPAELESGWGVDGGGAVGCRDQK